MGGARGLSDVQGWTHERRARGRGKRIHATEDIAAVPLSRENRDALSCLMTRHHLLRLSSTCSTSSATSAAVEVGIRTEKTTLGAERSVVLQCIAILGARMKSAIHLLPNTSTYTLNVYPANSRFHITCGPGKSHNLRVLSPLPHSASRPSGAKATELTEPECAQKRRISRR